MIKPVARPEQLPSLDIRVLDPSSAPRGSALQPTAYVADSLIVFARDPAAVQAVIARLVGPGVGVSVAPLFPVDEDAFGEAAERLIFHGAHGTPGVAEYLSLEVSALLAISPGSGACLIGQVLNCVYRHPLLWDAVRAGAVRWYRASEIISEVNSAGLCQAAAQGVDQQITPRLASLPRGRAMRLLRGLDRPRRSRRKPGSGNSRPGLIATSRCGTRAWSPARVGT